MSEIIVDVGRGCQPEKRWTELHDGVEYLMAHCTFCKQPVRRQRVLRMIPDKIVEWTRFNEDRQPRGWELLLLAISGVLVGILIGSRGTLSSFAQAVGIGGGMWAIAFFVTYRICIKREKIANEGKRKILASHGAVKVANVGLSNEHWKKYVILPIES